MFQGFDTLSRGTSRLYKASIRFSKSRLLLAWTHIATRSDPRFRRLSPSIRKHFLPVSVPIPIQRSCFCHAHHAAKQYHIIEEIPRYVFPSLWIDLAHLVPFPISMVSCEDLNPADPNRICLQRSKCRGQKRPDKCPISCVTF